MIPEYLTDLKNQIPNSLYEELEYVAERHTQGRESKEALNALIEDAVRFVEENRRTPKVKARQTPAGNVYVLNAEEDADDEGFNLLSEPTEDCFANNFFDVIQEPEVYRASTPLEQRGRVNAPLYLDRWTDFLIDGERRKVAGVDIARYGDDSSVIVGQDSGHVTDIQSYLKQDVNETTGRVVAFIDEHRVDEVVIDITGGLGAGCFDRLRELGFEELVVLTPVTFNALPRSERLNAGNARAEAFLILSERFRLGTITLPRDKQLLEELAWLRYKYRSDGKIILEDKDAFKKRHKRSPDRADALALSFYAAGGLEIF